MSDQVVDMLAGVQGRLISEHDLRRLVGENEGMREILRRCKAKLEAGRHISRLDRDDLLASIDAYLAGK